MPDSLRHIVSFRADRLFDGAVNLDWFRSDRARAQDAASAFVFHGPAYHGVSQTDVGMAHGHRLQDTASFARSVVKRCYGLEDRPFTLAIAGYGTGKSHLALTLAALLSDPAGKTANAVLGNICGADQAVGSEIRAVLREVHQPCLVVALNGMQNFDLTTAITRQIVDQVEAANLDTRPLDNLRPRFSQAAELIRMAQSNMDLVSELVAACETGGIEEILAGLEQQDEGLYGKVHEVLLSRNIRISALGGESVRDVLDVAVREYCGSGKPFKCLVVLFDEFGRYTEFATVRSHIAGSGVLQDLFEAIQANTGAACFVGFIQFELNAYVQRVAPEHRNEILRYVTRYQTADRVYLSINLETLIASLLEKKKPEYLDQRFDNEAAELESSGLARNIARWFPQSANHRLWGDSHQFHTVLRKGCWPLSAYSTWFLFHLAAAGKHLQERSALGLLRDAFDRFEDRVVEDDTAWNLAPVDLWSDTLQQELITSEEGGQQGSITHAYASVASRHGTQLGDELERLLRAVVLGSKLGLKASDRGDAVAGLSALAGVNLGAAASGMALLQDEYNVVEWDEAFKEFDILGDAVPRTQFLAFVRQRVASTYDEAGRAALFASKAANWCEILRDLECDFAEDKKITTREWRFVGVTSSVELLPMQVKLASDRWASALGVDEPRGTIAYCYVEPSRDLDAVSQDTTKLLRTAAKQFDLPALPILVVLLHDEEGVLGQALAELAVLDESMSEEERASFRNLIPAHREKTLQVVESQVESMIKHRHHVSACKDPLDSGRLSRAGAELFERIYHSVLDFPFDGFSTARGNAADSCQELISDLLLGKLDYDALMGKPVRVKNRGIAVLNDSWGVFSKTGSIRTRPNQPTLKGLTVKWDEVLASDGGTLSLGAALRQLCGPPYGANLASAGLFLGVFVAPRIDKLSVVRDGQSYAISQWLKDGVFRGKFLDIESLHGVGLALIGEASAEWETLLDEWEQAESHSARGACLERALELKDRVPVPPSLGYRYLHHEEQSESSWVAIAEMAADLQKALDKVRRGTERGDASLISWGGAGLLALVDRMTEEQPLWTEQEIESIRPSIGEARQATIQCFLDWLATQAPASGTPDAAGDFKHKMLRLVGGNLKKLGLEDLYRQLEARTLDAIKRVETTVEARQLIRDVEAWLTSHGDAIRLARVAELRALQEVGKEYTTKLQGMSKRIDMPEIGELRTRLAETLRQMKTAKEDIVKRASRLWESEIRSEDDLDALVSEVDAVTAAFENCPVDLEDFLSMRRALRMYQRDYQHLSDERLSWAEFEEMVHRYESEARTSIGEQHIPWHPEAVFAYFLQAISTQRTERSVNWVNSLATETLGVEGMSIADASRLHARASSPPEVLTEADASRLRELRGEIEARLHVLKLEWLVEEFKKLPLELRLAFLDMIARERGS